MSRWEIQQAMEAVERRYQMGGLSEGLYAQFVMDVIKELGIEVEEEVE